jgi:hypothetical protein
MSLSSLTSGAQSAAVYVRAPGKTKQIAFSLCRPCSTSGNGSYSGPPAATSTLLGAALAREAYVNVATKKNPAGEIRGQVRQKVSRTCRYGEGRGATPPGSRTSHAIQLALGVLLAMAP